MPRDGGGISRMGNKHKKPSKFDIHRKLKQPKQPEAAEEEGDGGQRQWAFEESIVRGIRRCEGDWQEALEGLIRVEVLNEYTDVPEMYEIISKMPDGDEILKDLGELEAVEQHGMPLCMNPRAVNPKIILPPSPKRPPPPQPLPTRPRKRGTFKADVEAGIIPPPRGMRRDAC